MLYSAKEAVEFVDSDFMLNKTDSNPVVTIGFNLNVKKYKSWKRRARKQGNIKLQLLQDKKRGGDEQIIVAMK